MGVGVRNYKLILQHKLTVGSLSYFSRGANFSTQVCGQLVQSSAFVFYG